MPLTSRQLAALLWVAILAAWALALEGVRSCVREGLAILFRPQLLALFGMIIGYNLAVVWSLRRVSYWDATMLYHTIAFVAVGGIGSVSRAASKSVTYDGRFFLKTTLVNIEVMVLFAFLSDLFPFSFWIEFFLVMPLVALLGILVVVAEYREGAELAHGFLRALQFLVGLLLIGYVVWQVVTSYRRLMDLQVLFSLGLPFVMSIFFVPALFFACVLFAYDSAFDRSLVASGGDKRLARWKTYRLLLRFGLDLKALQAFQRSTAMCEYSWAKTKDEAIAGLTSYTGIVVNQDDASASAKADHPPGQRVDP